MRREMTYPLMTASLVLGPQHNAPRGAGRDLTVGLWRLAQSIGLGDRRGAVVPRYNTWGQRIQHERRRGKVAFQRVHAEQPTFVVVEIGQVEAHLTLAGRGDFDQP